MFSIFIEVGLLKLLISSGIYVETSNIVLAIGIKTKAAKLADF